MEIVTQTLVCYFIVDYQLFNKSLPEVCVTQKYFKNRKKLCFQFFLFGGWKQYIVEYQSITGGFWM